ncbi:helix-hairpin-helix domain-containing protein [Streptomyces sp. NPDC001617]
MFVADARRHGAAVLPIGVSRSRAPHDVEQNGQGWDVRLAFSTVDGIRAAEAARFVSGQTYASLQELCQGPASMPLAQRLIRIGALGPLMDDLTRRDLMLQATELHRQFAAQRQLSVTRGMGPGSW